MLADSDVFEIKNTGHDNVRYQTENNKYLI